MSAPPDRTEREKAVFAQAEQLNASIVELMEMSTTDTTAMIVSLSQILAELVGWQARDRLTDGLNALADALKKMSTIPNMKCCVGVLLGMETMLREVRMMPQTWRARVAAMVLKDMIERKVR